MNPPLVAREMRKYSERPWRRALIAGVTLLFGVACGSAQSDALPGGGGGASAAGNGGAPSGAAGSNVAGRGGDPHAGAGGINGGSAGTTGGDDGASGAAAGSGGKIDASAGSGSGGATAGGGDSGQGLACPANPPRASDSCMAEGRVCQYEDCASVGRTVATCERSGNARLSWRVQAAPCGAVRCVGLPGQMSCASGQICTVSEGGTITGTCAPSSCGSGPVTCACAQASCSDCAISGSAEQGFTVTCNSCPQGGCP